MYYVNTCCTPGTSFTNTVSTVHAGLRIKPGLYRDGGHASSRGAPPARLLAPLPLLPPPWAHITVFLPEAL